MALLLFAACTLSETPTIGEFPRGLFAFGNTGVLATEYVAQEHWYQTGEFRYYRVLSDGSLAAIFADTGAVGEGAGSVNFRNSVFAAAGTATSDEEIIFLLTSVGDANVLATRITKKDSVTRALDLRNLGRNIGISMLERDPSRHWVWVSNSNGVEGSPVYPLIEFEGGNATVLETNVLWAHCGTRWCQQLRTEGKAIRLYASPATSDEYLRPVTESNSVFLPHVGNLRTCAMNSETTVVYFEHTYYFLSATEPALAAMPLAEVTEKYPHFAMDCPSIGVDEKKQRSERDEARDRSYSRGLIPSPVQFADKTSLYAESVMTGTVDAPGCSWYGRLQDDCDVETEIYSTRLLFQSKDREHGYYVHELE
jgi:hypothetical protein